MRTLYSMNVDVDDLDRDERPLRNGARVEVSRLEAPDEVRAKHKACLLAEQLCARRYGPGPRTTRAYGVRSSTVRDDAPKAAPSVEIAWSELRPRNEQGYLDNAERAAFEARQRARGRA